MQHSQIWLTTQSITMTAELTNTAMERKMGAGHRHSVRETGGSRDAKKKRG